MAGVQPVEELRVAGRAPSGRSGDSTLITSAPARPRSRPHSGPAHIDDRSATTAPVSPAAGDGGAMRAACHEGQLRSMSGAAVGSTAAGTPSSWAAPASSSAGRTSAAAASPSAASTARGSTEIAASFRPSTPRIAGTAVRSSGRLSVTAHQPSAERSRKLEPPAEVLPRRVYPASAARAVISSAGSGRTRFPVSRVTCASSSVTVSSMARTGAGDGTGAPSGCPVSDIAPDAAHSSTAQHSSMTDYR